MSAGNSNKQIQDPIPHFFINSEPLPGNEPEPAAPQLQSVPFNNIASLALAVGTIGAALFLGHHPETVTGVSHFLQSTGMGKFPLVVPGLIGGLAGGGPGLMRLLEGERVNQAEIITIPTNLLMHLVGSAMLTNLF